MYKVAIFDLDGTLLNTITDLSTACNIALRAFGYQEHDEEIYKTYVGNGIYKLVERSLPEGERDTDNVLRVKAIFDMHYAAHSLDETKPYDGVIELLEKLKAKGIACGVVTNKAHDYAIDLVKQFFDERVTYTLGQRENVPTKPHPHSVLEMMSYFGAQPEECLYIGDSNVDMQTAKAASVESVGVLWGFRSKKELIEAGANYLAGNIKQLEEILLAE